MKINAHKGLKLFHSSSLSQTVDSQISVCGLGVGSILGNAQKQPDAFQSLSSEAFTTSLEPLLDVVPIGFVVMENNVAGGCVDIVTKERQSTSTTRRKTTT